MTYLIIGTPSSGKSQKAEDITLELAEGKEKYYIATMIPFGEEGEKRIERHRKLRAGKGFVTIEKPLRVDEVINKISKPGEATCLLECMSNLVGNEMHDEKNLRLSKDKLADMITGSVMKVEEAVKNLVIVTNHFPLEDESYDEDTSRYVELVSLVNDRLVACCDHVYELKDGEWVLR